MKKLTKKYIWEKFVSPYIRLRDSDWNGYGNCISCNKKIFWKEGHAGHFLPKSRGDIIYFEEDNIHLQCPTCNCYGSNDTGYDYGKALERKIGQDRIYRLKELQRRTKSFTASQLKIIRDLYAQKLEEIKKIRGI